MNNYCRNCGKELDTNEKLCSSCGAEVIDSRVNIEEKEKEIDEFKKREKNYITLIAAFFLGGVTLNSFEDNPLQFLSSICILISVIILIYARIVLGNSKTIRTLFLIGIILFIFSLIVFILFVTSCFSFFKYGCP